MQTYYVVSWNKNPMEAALNGYWFNNKEVAMMHRDFDERLFVITIDVEVDSGAAQS